MVPVRTQATPNPTEMVGRRKKSWAHETSISSESTPPQKQSYRKKRKSKDPGNMHGGECLLKDADWAYQWASSTAGKKFTLKNWKSCPKSLDLVDENGKGEYLNSTLNLPHINGTLSLSSQKQEDTRKPVNVEVLWYPRINWLSRIFLFL